MIILKILIVSKNIVNITMFFSFYSIITIGDFMGKLIIISGPSGVGKGTIINKLKKIYQDNNKNLYVSVSYTTREKRKNEREGVDYYFISLEEFVKKINENGLLEYNQYGTGKYYGTPKDKIFDYLDNGYDVILEIDVNGFIKVREQGIDFTSLFIAPPSINDLEERLRTRNTETEEVINKRLLEARRELASMNLYDNIIYNENDRIDDTVDSVLKVINEKKYVK
jgi:guanylate kinase